MPANDESRTPHRSPSLQAPSVLLLQGFYSHDFLRQRRNGKGAGIGLNNTNNDSKNTQRRRKDFDNQNFDKQTGILGIGNGARRPRHAHGHTRGNVGESYGEAGTEHTVAGIVKATVIPVLVQVVARVFGFFDFVGQDNGHDDSVNGGGFTENDTAVCVSKKWCVRDDDAGKEST